MNPVVKTTHGSVMGELRGDVAIFRGIPYGGSCEGEHRFLPPRPAENWEGIKDCTKNGPIAMQFGGSISGSQGLGPYFSGNEPEKFGTADEKHGENCLLLNVLTPGTDDKKRPVLVYFHGGGFATGTGSIVLGSDKLVSEEDIVIVGVNHRLNVFGYLYLGAIDEKYAESGMAGILDLVLSLEWVRDNIAAFGGDPDKVTIMGESGGGAKVSTMLALPRAKGLFHHAIVESGSNPAGTVTRESAAETARKLMSELGLAENDIDGLLKTPAYELLKASAKQPGFSFSPVPDDINLMYNPALNFAPETARDIPVMVGASEDEMAVFMPPQAFDVTWDTLPEKLIQRGIPADRVHEYIETYRRTGKSSNDAAHTFMYIVSTEGILGWNAHLQAQALAKQGGAPVYQYLVRYDAPHPLMPGVDIAWHTADLPLQFRIVPHPELEELSRTYARAWAAFVRTGNPSTAELPWPAYTTAAPCVMIFDDICHIEHEPLAPIIALHDCPAPHRMEEF
ncbi:MAG: carboxylesterase/lipase family protein [Clostridia bacterium]|nr:carboxylesterase/lipase family protein [Clostridia bacterium]